MTPASSITSKAALGFWLYLMTDCVLFACLFATYAVLQHNTFGGPGASQLFDTGYAMAETLILLTSSYTAGLAVLAARQSRPRAVAVWLVLTFGLGAAFLGLELTEFIKLSAEGNGWQRSGFLSAFFTLVGTHGLHITSGLVWLACLAPGLVRYGITPLNLKRLGLFSMFWHFLDVIWIFIFTFVYLLGAVQ